MTAKDAVKEDARKLNQIVTRLDQMIEELKGMGYGETVALMQMVRLDLFSRMHGISADELDALLFVARSEQHLTGGGEPPPKVTPRQRVVGGIRARSP